MDAADSGPSLAREERERRQACELEAQIDTCIRSLRAAKTPSLQRHYDARLRELMALRHAP